MQKKHENTTVLNKTKKSTICEFKCWLSCQLAPFEALLSLKKKHQRSNAIAERGACLRLVVQKRYPSKWRNFYVIPHHIGQSCPDKEFRWSRNGAFFGTTKRPRRTSLLVIPALSCRPGRYPSLHRLPSPTSPKNFTRLRSPSFSNSSLGVSGANTSARNLCSSSFPQVPILSTLSCVLTLARLCPLPPLS